MSPSAWRTVRYWSTRTLAGQARSLVGLVVLVALLGGLAMGALAGARRTQSAFPRYLARSHASNLQLYIFDLTHNFDPTAPARLTGLIARQHDVVHVATSPTLFFAPRVASVPAAIAANDVNFIGSAGGAYTTQDRPALVAGRLANPASPNELVASADAARLLGWNVGERVALDAYSVAQVVRSPSYPPTGAVPVARLTPTLVGIVQFANGVAHDDVDRYPAFVLATPALTRAHAGSAGFSSYELTLRHGDADVSLVEREMVSLLPPGTVYAFHVTSIVEGQVERAIRPESIALSVFGGIAALVALLIGAQALRRLASAKRGEVEVLRALGATRASLLVSTVLAPIAAVALGAVLAAGVAVALSPLAPLGAVRVVEPSPGIDADAAVLVLGTTVLVLVLAACAVGFSAALIRAVPRGRARVERKAVLPDASARAGLPVPAVTGLRFALEGRAGGVASPARSLLAASVVAVVVVVATLTFASGLATLESHPALYGWNWSGAIFSRTGSSIPPVVVRELSSEPTVVAAWSGYSFANAQFDGVTVPILLVSLHSRVQPPLLAGHGVDAPNEVVLGAGTLAQLHRHLGGTVTASYGTRRGYPVYVPPTRLRIVGVATMPSIGNSGNLHTSMGLGAELATAIEPPAFRAALHQPDPNLNGPELYAVRFARGTSPTVGFATLARIARDATATMAKDPNGGGATYEAIGAQRPAEIVTYESTGATPAVLALGLAAGAVAALGLALAASVRRRRRDLALLKTLGLTRRQLAATIAWQASVVAVVGVLLGVPLGIALGRWLWVEFAHQIAVVPQPTVPALEVVAVAGAALVLANVVAAVPGRAAARTPAALVLRSE
ncbi:MAG TPA: FtsX-like permease family protein [Acidimicrobiales bacterium]|jgi:hypothetical protein|nr:FtsX-like permease family protein [Acidimicrobiales bacterium]